MVNSVITESAGKIGIGAATPAGPLDVGGWTGLPGNIVGVSANLSGDAFMGNTGVNVGRFRMSSNANQGFFSWNQYFNGAGHKGLDAANPGWRVNIGGAPGAGEDAFYVERSPATGGLHAPARLLQVSGSGNVGIGTITPVSKLEVSGGDIRVSGGGKFIGDDSLLTNLPLGGTATDVACPAPCIASSEIVDNTIVNADIDPAAAIGRARSQARRRYWAPTPSRRCRLSARRPGQRLSAERIPPAAVSPRASTARASAPTGRAYMVSTPQLPAFMPE